MLKNAESRWTTGSNSGLFGAPDKTELWKLDLELLLLLFSLCVHKPQTEGWGAFGWSLAFHLKNMQRNETSWSMWCSGTNLGVNGARCCWFLTFQLYLAILVMFVLIQRKHCSSPQPSVFESCQLWSPAISNQMGTPQEISHKKLRPSWLWTQPWSSYASSSQRRL